MKKTKFIIPLLLSASLGLISCGGSTSNKEKDISSIETKESSNISESTNEEETSNTKESSNTSETTNNEESINTSETTNNEESSNISESSNKEESSNITSESEASSTSTNTSTESSIVDIVSVRAYELYMPINAGIDNAPEITSANVSHPMYAVIENTNSVVSKICIFTIDGFVEIIPVLNNNSFVSLDIKTYNLESDPFNIKSSTDVGITNIVLDDTKAIFDVLNNTVYARSYDSVLEFEINGICYQVNMDGKFDSLDEDSYDRTCELIDIQKSNDRMDVTYKNYKKYSYIYGDNNTYFIEEYGYDGSDFIKSKDVKIETNGNIMTVNRKDYYNGYNTEFVDDKMELKKNNICDELLIKATKNGNNLDIEKRYNNSDAVLDKAYYDPYGNLECCELVIGKDNYFNEYSYDYNGDITEIKISKNGDRVGEYRLSYNGLVLEEILYIKNNSNYLTKFEYDDLNKFVKKYSFGTVDDGDSFKQQYSYDIEYDSFDILDCITKLTFNTIDYYEYYCTSYVQEVNYAGSYINVTTSFYDNSDLKYIYESTLPIYKLGSFKENYKCYQIDGNDKKIVKEQTYNYTTDYSEYIFISYDSNGIVEYTFKEINYYQNDDTIYELYYGYNEITKQNDLLKQITGYVYDSNTGNTLTNYTEEYNFVLLDGAYVISSGEKCIKNCEYYSNGSLKVEDSVIYHLNENNEFDIDERVRAEYTEAGDYLLKEVYDYSDTLEKLILRKSESYKYDDDGRRIEKLVIYYIFNEEIDSAEKETNVYSDELEGKYIYTYDKTNDNWVMTMLNETKFDAAHKKIEAVSTNYYSDGSINNGTKYVYVRDDNETLFQVQNYLIKKDGTYSYNSVSDYSYDNNKVYSIIFSYVNNGSTFSPYYKYEYNGSNYSYYLYENGGWVFKHTAFITYEE